MRIFRTSVKATYGSDRTCDPAIATIVVAPASCGGLPWMAMQPDLAQLQAQLQAQMQQTLMQTQQQMQVRRAS